LRYLKEQAKWRKKAEKLIAKHLDPTAWDFEFTKHKRRLGECHYRLGMVKGELTHVGGTIKASYHILGMPDADTHIKDTILHEIAHAKVGPRHGHDRVWRTAARQLGCTANRRGPSMQVKGKWSGTCHKCGYVIYRHRRTPRMTRLACERCCKAYNGGQYTDKFRFDWSSTIRG
jgi:hypothetical protein